MMRTHCHFRGKSPIPASGFFITQHVWIALSCSSACLKLFTVYCYFAVNKGHSTRALPNSIFGEAGEVLLQAHELKDKKTPKLSRKRFIFPKEHLLLTDLMKIYTLNHKSRRTCLPIPLNRSLPWLENLFKPPRKAQAVYSEALWNCSHLAASLQSHKRMGISHVSIFPGCRM